MDTKESGVINTSPEDTIRNTLEAYLDWAYAPNARHPERSNVDDAQQRLVRRVADSAIIAYIANTLHNDTSIKNAGSRNAILRPFTSDIDALIASKGNSVQETVQNLIQVSRYRNNQQTPVIIYPFRHYAGNEHFNGLNSLRQSPGEVPPLDAKLMRRALNTINEALKNFLEIKIAPTGFGAKSEKRARDKIDEKIDEAKEDGFPEKAGQLIIPEIKDLIRISVVYTDVPCRELFWYTFNQMHENTKADQNHSTTPLGGEPKAQYSGFLATYGEVSVKEFDGDRTGFAITGEIQSQHQAMDRIYPITHVLQEIERDIDIMFLQISPERKQEIIMQATVREGEDMERELLEYTPIADFSAQITKYNDKLSGLLNSSNISAFDASKAFSDGVYNDIIEATDQGCKLSDSLVYAVQQRRQILNKLPESLGIVSLDSTDSFTRDELLAVAFIERCHLLDKSMDTFKEAYTRYRQSFEEHNSHSTEADQKERLQAKNDAVLSILSLKKECFAMRQLIHVCSVFSADVSEEYQNRWLMRMNDKVASGYSKKSNSLENMDYMIKLLALAVDNSAPLIRPTRENLQRYMDSRNIKNIEELMGSKSSEEVIARYTDIMNTPHH